jgi:transcriptional regulator with XRE-family HTH domain
MPKWSVETHPKSEKLIKEIIAGKDSQRNIARRYGLSNAAISRYLQEKLIPQAAKVASARERWAGGQVLEEIDRVMGRMNKLYDACDEYLTDPERPERYTLQPHAHELDVLYTTEEPNGRGEGTHTVTHRENLKNMIDLALKQARGELVEVRYRHADPRKLIIDTASVLTKQLEIIAKIQGEIKDIEINIHISQFWQEIKAVILKVTANAPDIREQLVAELARIPGA